MAEMTKDTPKYIWPLTVTTERYRGGYSKGKFLAFNLLPWQLPEEIESIVMNKLYELDTDQDCN